MPVALPTGRSVLFSSITKGNCLGLGRSTHSRKSARQATRAWRESATVTSKASTQRRQLQHRAMPKHWSLCALAASWRCTDEAGRPTYTPGLQSGLAEEGAIDPEVQAPTNHTGSPWPSGNLAPGPQPPHNYAHLRESEGQLVSQPCSGPPIRSDSHRVTRTTSGHWKAGLENLGAGRHPLVTCIVDAWLLSCIT